MRDPSSSITRTRSRIYSALNRLTQEIGGAGQTTDFEYDLQGNQTAVIVDPLGLNQRTTSEYDALNRLAKSIDPDLGETEFVYDARDNLVSVTDAENLSTTFTYDGLENLTAQDSPDTGITLFTYDDAGNRLTQTAARGVVAQFDYDALNRLVSITYPDATKNVSFGYDAGANGVGRLTSMVDESGSTDFGYDIQGNLVSETRTVDGVAYVTAYTYDSANRVLTMTYPSGTIISYTRDGLGRIDSVSADTGDGPQSLATNITYLPFGPARAFDYGNGISVARIFDQDYRLTDQTAGTVQDISLGYDPADNITSLADVLDGTRSQIFAYDTLNRLSQGQGIYGTRGYTYDGIGNRLTITTPAGVDSYSYGVGNHHLESISGPNGTGFSYDANGNTVAKGPLGFTYDDTNRMTQASASGLIVGDYVYNGKGERVKKTAAGITTVFHYDSAGLLIAETDTLGNVLREYVYLDGQPLALIEPADEPADIVLDSVTSSAATDSSLTWSHSVGTGEDRLLIVEVTTKQTAVSSVTYGGTPLSFLDSAANDDHARVEFWYLVDPPAGTASIVVSLPMQDKITAGSVSYSGVDQSSPLGVWTAATGESATPSVGGIPANAGDVVIDVVASALGAKVITPATSQPALWTENIEPADQNVGGGGSAMEIEDDTSATMTWNLDKSRKWAIGAVAIRSAIGAGSTGTIYYYHNDHLGTPRRLSDATGNVVWSADYEPFGNVQVTVNTVSNNLRFPGQYFDQETGLHYNYFRYYSPDIGRYLRSDPLGLLADFNTYLYAAGNPVRFTDPEGLSPNRNQGILGRLFGKKGAQELEKLPGGAEGLKCATTLTCSVVNNPQLDSLIFDKCVPLLNNFGAGARAAFLNCQATCKKKLNECVVGCPTFPDRPFSPVV